LGENYYKGDLVLFLLFFSTAHTLAKKNYSKIVSASYEWFCYSISWIS